MNAIAAGLEEKGGGRCGTTGISPEPSGAVVHGCSGVQRGGDPRTTGQEKGGGYQSDASGAGLFEAGGGTD